MKEPWKPRGVRSVICSWQRTFHSTERKEGKKEVSYPKVNSTAQPTCGSVANLSDKQLKLKNNLSYFGFLSLSILPFLAVFFFSFAFSGKHDIGSLFFFLNSRISWSYLLSIAEYVNILKFVSGDD